MRGRKFMKLLGVIVICMAMIITTPISAFAEDTVQTDNVQQTTQEDINQDESNNNQDESGTTQNEGEQAAGLPGHST